MRYHEIMDAGSPLTDKEVFSLLNISDHYRQFRKLKKSSDEKTAFRNATGLSYRDFLQAKRPPAPDALNLFRILDINKLCCMRTVRAAPVWPDYNPSKPPGSGIELDTGAVKRYAKRIPNFGQGKGAGRFENGELRDDEYITTGGTIRAEVEFTVSDEELEGLSV